MPGQVILPFLVYSFITSITPGPANLCTLSTALHYGKAAALRQWRGLAAGFFLDAVAAVLVNRLLGSLLGDAVKYLSWIGAAYIFYMAWRILRSAGAAAENDRRQPGFLSGLLLNLSNVKVILFCITAMSAFVLPYTDSLRALFATGLVLTVIGPSCNLIWLLAGVTLQRFFARYQKTVDILMAISLALCAVNLLLPPA